MINAIIMAAGMSSRFVPLCWERPKALLSVKGEILIERQIRQLRDAGVDDVTIVTGYRAGMFSYLEKQFGVRLVCNPDYARYNNTSTLMCVLDQLQDTWLCSSDNYFTENVFMEHPASAQYSSQWAEGETDEYCMFPDPSGAIGRVTVGGRHAWIMIGHVYFSRTFSEAFKQTLVADYQNEAVRHCYWEDVFSHHLAELPPMKIRKFKPGIINEFDSLSDLRRFDRTYIDNTRSAVLQELARRLQCREGDIVNIKKCPRDGYQYTFSFDFNGNKYVFLSNNWEHDFKINRLNDTK